MKFKFNYSKRPKMSAKDVKNFSHGDTNAVSSCRQ